MAARAARPRGAKKVFSQDLASGQELSDDEAGTFRNRNAWPSEMGPCGGLSRDTFAAEASHCYGFRGSRALVTRLSLYRHRDDTRL